MSEAINPSISAIISVPVTTDGEKNRGNDFRPSINLFFSFLLSKDHI